MWRIRTHRMGIDQGSQVLFSDFEHNGEMWAGEGPREVRVPVTFSEPFLSPPAILVGLSMWDMDHSTNPRMEIDVAASVPADVGIAVQHGEC